MPRFRATLGCWIARTVATFDADGDYNRFKTRVVVVVVVLSLSQYITMLPCIVCPSEELEDLSRVGLPPSPAI